MKKRIFRRAFVLLFVIGFLDFFANYFYLYWTIWWLDILMHFLGGVCVALGGISLWPDFFNGNGNRQLKIILTGIFWVLLVGIIWEIFELQYGVTFLSDGTIYVRDTTSDIIMDICGGFFGALYALNLQKKNNGQ